MKKNILLILYGIIIMAAISAPARSEEIVSFDTQQLIAQWQRTDGPYVIDISKVKQDGTIDAAYYNPKPINVSQASFMEENGELSIAIELRDVGYLGSTYALTYSSKNDALIGEYFHAGLKRTFNVIFLRNKD